MGIGNWLSLGQLNDSDGATELRGVVDRHGHYDGGYVLMVRAGQIYDPDHSCDGIQAIAIHAGTGLYAESDWGDGVFGYTKGDGNSGAVGKNDAGGYGVYGHSARGTGVYGESPAGDGVFGYSTSNDNSGAVGKNDAGGYGVYGHSEQGTGIYGESLAVEGDRMIGVHGVAVNRGTGVKGETQNGTGVLGISPSGTYDWGDGGVVGVASAETGGAGVLGISDSTNDGVGVLGRAPQGDGVFGYSTGDQKSGAVGRNDAGGYGVFGHSERGTGVYGESLATEGDRRIGVHGVAVSDGTGVQGETQDGPGVSGQSVSGPGVEGRSGSYVGVDGFCLNGTGVHGLGGDSGVTGTSQKGYGGTFGGPRARAAIRLLPAETPGAPTTGTHQVGELFVDSQGALYYCRKGGTPGTWVTLAP